MAEVVQVNSRPTRQKGLHLTTVVLTDGQGGRAEAGSFARGRRLERALRRTLPPGTRVEASGDVQRRRGGSQTRSPAYEVVPPEARLEADETKTRAEEGAR